MELNWHVQQVLNDTKTMIQHRFYAEAHSRLRYEAEKARDLQENGYLGYDDDLCQQYETLLHDFEERHVRKPSE